eukprot:1929834-Rhodomonas_salina.1
MIKQKLVISTRVCFLPCAAPANYPVPGILIPGCPGTLVPGVKTGYQGTVAFPNKPPGGLSFSAILGGGGGAYLVFAKTFSRNKPPRGLIRESHGTPGDPWYLGSPGMYAIPQALLVLLVLCIPRVPGYPGTPGYRDLRHSCECIMGPHLHNGVKTMLVECMAKGSVVRVGIPWLTYGMPVVVRAVQRTVDPRALLARVARTRVTWLELRGPRAWARARITWSQL